MKRLHRPNQAVIRKEHYHVGDQVFLGANLFGTVVSKFEHDNGYLYRVEYLDHDGLKSSACLAAFEMSWVVQERHDQT